MSSFIHFLDGINDLVGRWVRWLAVALVLVQFFVVVLRYVFGTSFMAAQESIIYIHAVIFMAGAGYTLLKDGHVRVDIFYGEASRRTRALVDLFGSLFLLIPSCLVLLYYTWGFVVQSWRILEGPISVGGIPAVFLLKSLIPIFGGLLLLQGISMALRNLLVLLGREADEANA
ncbi:MAG TPA: TRAP transporter small permease subunit [Kiloniellales bacterium]|nr:TRAP transporter small permease subunit [Kiloniellales bacterium]